MAHTNTQMLHLLFPHQRIQGGCVSAFKHESDTSGDTHYMLQKHQILPKHKVLLLLGAHT
jgi:hypothetical protein